MKIVVPKASQHKHTIDMTIIMIITAHLYLPFSRIFLFQILPYSLYPTVPIPRNSINIWGAHRGKRPKTEKCKFLSLCFNDFLYFCRCPLHFLVKSIIKFILAVLSRNKHISHLFITGFVSLSLQPFSFISNS